MHGLMRMVSFCLSLMLLMMPTALADGTFLMHSNGWSLDGTAVDVLLKADVNTHMPYDADRLAMLTPVTDLLTMHLVTGDDEGMVSIAAEEVELLRLQYCGNQIQLSSMPGITYVAAEDPIGTLLDADVSFSGVYEELGLARDSESLLRDGRTLMEKIPSAFEQNGKKSKNTTSISGFGRAAYVMDYTFQPKQLTVLQEQLNVLIPEGWLKDIVGGLTFSGKQSIRMHFTADDVLIRLEYNGTCGPKEDLRAVKLVYKLLHDAETDKDFIELSAPAKKGKNKTVLSFERTIQTNKKGARTLKGQYEYIVAKDGVTSTRAGEFDLANAYTDTSDVITGEAAFRSRLNGAEKYDEIILTPDLIVSGTEESPLITGRLGIEEKYAGRTTEKAIIHLDLKQAGGLQWNEGNRTVDLSAMDETALSQICNEVAASVATAFVRPMIIKLGKDAQWFFRDLSDETVQAIIDAASAAEK